MCQERSDSWLVGTGLSWWDNLAVFQVGSLLLQQATPDLLSRKWYGREGEGERCWGRDFEGEVLKENIQDHFRPSLGKACYFCHNSLCLKQIKAAHIQRLGNKFYLLGEVAELPCKDLRYREEWRIGAILQSF